MNGTTRFFLVSGFGVVLAASGAYAAGGAWTGAGDAKWTNSLNWTGATYPFGSDTATFNGQSGNTTVDVGGLANIQNITFDTPNVTAYTLGTGATNSQTLVMGNNGTVQIGANAAASQTFNCAIQLGTLTNGASFTFRSDNPAQALTLNKLFVPAAGPINTRTINIEGVGETRILGDIQKGASSFLTFNYNGVGTLTLAGNNQIGQLNINGDPGSVINLAAGSTNTFYNAGGGNLVVSKDCTINGPGVLRLSDAGGEAYADNGAASGKTLTINATLLGTGFEYYHGSYAGIIALNGTNLFTGQVLVNSAGTVSAKRFGNRGSTTSGLGSGDFIRLNGGNARILYTGTGETTDRYLHFRGSPSIVEQAGSGTLTFSSTNICDAGSKTVQLQGSTDGVGEFSAALGNSSATLSLVKAGSGTWRLSAANTYSGTTAVSGGTLALGGVSGAITTSTGYTLSGTGTLLLDNTLSANNTNRLSDAATLSFSGGTLAVTNNGGSVDYAENAGPVSVTQGASTIAVTPAGASQKSTLRFASLARTGGTLNFAGVGLGASDQNRIFITGQSDGLLGAWATVNGTSYAAYSSASGVYASSMTVTNIAAQGSDTDSIVPDNASADVHITTPGTAGSDTLAGASVNSVFSLQQDSGTTSTVATAGKTLKAAQIAISAGSASLTVGDNPGDGLLAPLAAGGVLALRNDSADSTLTVNAAVADTSSASALAKYGAGKALLNASNTYSGATMIYGGTLAFGGAVTQSVTSAIGGAGALAKEGSGRLTLSGANTYTGLTVVSAGTLALANNSALGAKTEGTVVASGATLDVGGSSSANGLGIDAEPITVSGTGVNGRGAIVNNSTNSQYNALTLVNLAGDVTFGGENSNARWDIRTTSNGSKAYLNMNDHSVTKVGSNMVGLTAVEVSPGAGNIDVKEGSFTMEVGTRLNGSAANTVTVRSGAFLDLYNMYYPQLWSLVLDDNARVYVRQGSTTYWNLWDGPVTLNGRAVFDSGSGHQTFRGAISGSGPLVKIGGSALYLRGTNTYSGVTTVSNGTLYAQTPYALPGYDSGRFTLIGGATLLVHAFAPGIGWTAENIRDVIANSMFSANSAIVAVDTTFAPLTYPYDVTRAVSLTKQGDSSLTVTGSINTESPLRLSGGETVLSGEADHMPGTVYTYTANLTLSDGAFVYVKSNSCYIADSSAANVSRVTLKDRASWSGFLYPYNVNQSTLNVGQTGRGILVIQDEASVTQKLYVGNNPGSAGAVYQNGGRMHNWGGANSDGRIGESGYGYYELNSGTFTNNGYFQIGHNFTGVGILKQTGGKFEMGTVYNGQLGISRGGTGVVYMAGGTFATGTGANQSNPTVDIGNSSDNGATNGFAELTLAGTASATVAGYINIGDRYNMFATLNLNGGTLEANYISKANRTNTTALVNFNGGTFRARQGGNLISTGVNTPTAVNIYGGGATFDVPTNLACALPVPLVAPPGNGVSGLSVVPTSGYIGAPMVTLSGGGGTGATAVATFDSASGTLTGIEMTNPGYGYTSTPSVSLGGGGSNAYPAVTGVTLVPNQSGGLTKQGAGTLTLFSTNTYRGATKVLAGTLKAGLLQSIPTVSTLVAAGGTLDLGGFAVTNGGVTLAGGLIANGSPACGTVSKTGSGTSTLGVPVVTPTTLVVSNGTLNVRRAGLWEGVVYGEFATSSNNPRTAVQLTTRMANTTAGWAITNTWIYSGTIWNRSSAPVTWTFAENVDDNVYLKIDSTVMMTNGIGWSTPTWSTITLDPGPHSFIAYFGQGGGGAGPVKSYWWTNTTFGFGIDYQGRNEANILNFTAMTDPGDGSLLTLDAAGLTNQLDAASTVEVLSGAVLDFGQGVQTLAGLSGSGTVTNGALTVTGAITPGGDGTVGTLTVASALTPTGTLRVDVGANGASDCLAVLGDLNLSGLVLEIANPAALDLSRTYTIATFTGTRSGSFSSLTVPDSRWHVIYGSNNKVLLTFVNGTVISFR